jgi:hypothetical protein
MSKYKARDYHNAELFPIEFSDSVTWRVRDPLVKDVDRLGDIHRAQTARFEAYRDALVAKAEAARQAAEADDGDEAARKLIDEQPDQDPHDISKLYLTCEVLAAFIMPAVTASEAYERLTADFPIDSIYEMHQELMERISGDAAKKRMRGR